MDRYDRGHAAGGTTLMLDYALFAFLFVIECVTLRWAIGRGGLIPFPIGTMGYIVCAQAILLLHAKGVMDYDFLRIYTSYAYIYHLRAMLLLFAAIFFLLTLCVPKVPITIAEQLKVLVVSDVVLWAIVIGVAIADIYLFTQFDWPVLWSNRIYLTMAGNAVLVQPNAVSATLFQLHSVLGVGAIVTCVYAFYTRRLAVMAVGLPFAIWHLLFSIASHSRYGVAYLLLAGILAAILSKRRRGAIVLIGLGILVQISALEGRNSGHHGFSSLGEFIPNIFAYLDHNATGAISNFFEGAFVTAEYFARTFHYATIYKVLSLSPLISSLDGFGDIRATFEIQLHEYVPVSAVIEVLSFGVGYTMLFFGVELIAGKLSADLMSRRPGIVPLALNATVFLGSYLQFTYSTRTVFRIFVYTALICFVLSRIAAGRDRRAGLVRRDREADLDPDRRPGRSRRFVPR